MENHNKPQKSTMGAFFGGLMSGLLSGALMIGMFYMGGIALDIGGMAHGLPFMEALVKALPGMGLGIGVTGLFSGIMAAVRSNSTPESVSEVSRPTIGRTQVREHTVAVPVVAMDRAEEPTTRWTDRVSRNSSDTRIQEILNSRASDKDRASAILAARDAADQNSAASR